MTENPMEAIRQLMNRLKNEADKLGLDMVHAALMPSMEEGGPTMMQAVFALRPESIVEPAPAKTEEELEFERQFADIEQSFKMDERKTQQSNIADTLKSWLDGD